MYVFREGQGVFFFFFSIEREDPDVITDAVHDAAADCATRTRDDSIRSRSIDAGRESYRCSVLTLPTPAKKGELCNDCVSKILSKKIENYVLSYCTI